MACFLVSAAEAVVVTAIEKYQKKSELKLDLEGCKEINPENQKIPMSRKLHWLSCMLWGGVILLAFEHIWHGEVVPWAPFLTAMNDPGDTAEMLKEMATVGVSMALLITGIWVVIVLVADSIVKREPTTQKVTNTNL